MEKISVKINGEQETGTLISSSEIKEIIIRYLEYNGFYGMDVKNAHHRPDCYYCVFNLNAEPYAEIELNNIAENTDVIELEDGRKIKRFYSLVFLSEHALRGEQRYSSEGFHFLERIYNFAKEIRTVFQNIDYFLIQETDNLPQNVIRGEK
jgi:hypothetical protein